MPSKFAIGRKQKRILAGLLISAFAAGLILAEYFAAKPVLRIAIPDDRIGHFVQVSVPEWCNYRKNVDLHITALPYDVLYDEIVKSKTPERFDIVMLDDPWLPELADNGRLAVVPKRTFSADLGRFVPEFLRVGYYSKRERDHRPDTETVAGCFANGKESAACQKYRLYALPYVGNAQMLVFPRSMARASGTSPTWAELKNDFKAAGFSSRLNSNNSALVDFLPMLWAHGGCILGWENNTQVSGLGEGPSAPDRLAAKAALELSLELAADSPIQYSRFRDDDVFRFLSSKGGKVAGISWLAYEGSFSEVGAIKGAPDVSPPLMIGAMPSGPERTNKTSDCQFDSKLVGALGSWLLAVDSRSPNQNLAWEWIRWALTLGKDEQTRALANILKGEHYPQTLTERLDEEHLKIVRSSKPRPAHPRWHEIEDAFGFRIRQAHWRSISVDVALNRAHEDIERILDREKLDLPPENLGSPNVVAQAPGRR